ncbi:hypothetical protein F0562_019021 [Nyssa sinensis]|uniref:Uncharacterized protein n=1 Tax=Nyssa sinensis TaxID=561372 RepID=A0A5J4ZCS0_9ASTE|nr:hypothetical protein F0562_019021 [Nyssa sinensis]
MEREGVKFSQQFFLFLIDFRFHREGDITATSRNSNDFSNGDEEETGCDEISRPSPSPPPPPPPPKQRNKRSQERTSDSPESLSPKTDNPYYEDEFEISAPNVSGKILRFSRRKKKIRLVNMLSLTDAKLDFDPIDLDRLPDLLLRTRHVKDLTLGFRCIQVGSDFYLQVIWYIT